MVKMSADIGKNYYPEVMHRTFIINAGFGFRAAWAIIKPFLDRKTVSKFAILGSSYQKELFKHVDPESVPRELGGECECEGGCLNV